MKRPARLPGVTSLLCVFGLLAAGGASLEDARAQSECGGWELIENSTFGGLRGVTAVAPDDVWALRGTSMIRWNGADWVDFAGPDVGPAEYGWRLDAIGSVPPAHVWSAGLIGISPFYADVLLARWDGIEWDHVEPFTLRPQTVWPFNPRNGASNDIDGTGENDVWVIGFAAGFGDGGAGTVGMSLHWDGDEWMEIDVPPEYNDRNEFEAVAAIAPDDVWAVGYGTQLDDIFRCLTFHWDGSQWSHVPNPAEGIGWSFLYDVAALASDDVWACGLAGSESLFMHWDGSLWTIVESPGTERIQSLAAIASDDVWAVGWPDSYYYHWDGVAWSRIAGPEIPGGTSVNRTGGMAAAGPCDAWTVGGYFIGNDNHALTEKLQDGVTSAPSVHAAGLVLDVGPNPILRTATIRFDMEGDRIKSASIYDVRGQRVRTLAGPSGSSGLLTWDGLADGGHPVPAGAYYLRVESDGGEVLTRTLTVAR